MADSEPAPDLDALYQAAPEDFTARRSELAAAAKKRGDAARAKQISGARKPTTSASIVNRLVLGEPDVRARLADLGERLRSAHAGMAGDQIRELSAEQRRLVEELSRAAFRVAGIANPSAAVRDDVTGTLQAAVADPDVTARLGRLTKAEQWSGFGFGASAQVSTSERGAAAARPAKKARPAPQPASSSAREDDDRAQAKRRERERARAVLAAAERAKAEADDELSRRQTDLAAARLRRDDARERLTKAESAVAEAQSAYDAAKNASRDASDVVKAAKRGVSA
jgi:hypothetical protein